MLNTLFQFLSLTGMVLLVAVSCNSKPTVVEKVDDHSHTPGKLVSDNAPDAESARTVHEVVVKEVLNASRYTYLNVDEEGENYWIAVSRRKAEVGQKYYYAGGLQKRNFKSTEYNRVFDKLVLVSDIRELPIFTGNNAVDEAFAKLDGNGALPDQDVKITPPEDGITLEELFRNMDKYEGKIVKVRGKCVKINKQIMGRNWVHIQDGTGGDDPYDLTITTSVDVPVGTVVTFSGKITLNKDFGAGYFYEIIMEDGHTH